MPLPRPHLLNGQPDVPEPSLRQVRKDFRRFAGSGLPRDVEGHLRSEYDLDVSGSYAGVPLKNPWGKASGQLSMQLSQIEEAIEAGLAFVVLKTVIAQDSDGRQSMAAWATKESRMVAEPVIGRQSGATGWTISWKGRGWWRSFEDYLELVRSASTLGRDRQLLVVPSVKYHLPAPGEDVWRTEEYSTTTRALLDAYVRPHGVPFLPLEKDFSPTLAGSDRAIQRQRTLEWLRETPALIRGAARPGAIRVGLKLFNSLDDDAFQACMLAAVHGPGPSMPDFLVYANRLFDPEKIFDGHLGIAYGGPDLSDRNLRILSALRAGQSDGTIPRSGLELSATGDISSGRMAVEYALRGCTSFQLHTLFQLPLDVYAMTRGTKLERALHGLYFDPEDGLVVWLLHAARRLGLGSREPIRLLDVAGAGSAQALRPGDLDTKFS